MKCKYCSAEFDDKNNVCPLCLTPTGNYRSGMRKNTAKTIIRDDFVKSEMIPLVNDNEFNDSDNQSVYDSDVVSDDINNGNTEGEYNEYSDYTDDSETVSFAEKKSKSPVIIAIVLVLLIAGGIFALYKTGFIDKLLNSPANSDIIPTFESESLSDESESIKNTSVTLNTDVKFKKGKYKVIRKNGAPVYSTNENNNPPVHIFKENETVVINSFYINGNIKLGFVSDSEYNGWIDMTHIEFTGDDENTTAKITQSATNTTNTTRYEEPEPEYEEPEQNEPEQEEPVNTSRETGSYSVSDTVNDTVDGTLNIRSETDYNVDNIVAVLHAGDEVSVLEWDGEWAKIAYNGNEIGYVYGSYLE